MAVELGDRQVRSRQKTKPPKTKASAANLALADSKLKNHLYDTPFFDASPDYGSRKTNHSALR